jgi:pimeloyl-ACP methyl ester carboxylesterase
LVVASEHHDQQRRRRHAKLAGLPGVRYARIAKDLLEQDTRFRIPRRRGDLVLQVPDQLARHFLPRKALLHAYAIALEANPLAGIEPLLERFRAPARIVWGTADAIFSAASPDCLNRIFGNSRGVRRLEGRKLFWPEELPDVVAEQARALWGDELGRGSSTTPHEYAHRGEPDREGYHESPIQQWIRPEPATTATQPSHLG